MWGYVVEEFTQNGGGLRVHTSGYAVTIFPAIESVPDKMSAIVAVSLSEKVSSMRKRRAGPTKPRASTSSPSTSSGSAKISTPVDGGGEQNRAGVSPENGFTAAQLGAIAHLYRGEVYRSTIWRTRLDNTTNWAVVTLGIALSISFSSTDASPLPLLLVGFLTVFFLSIEARRYRYFNVWRARARWMETHLYAPMLDPSCALTHNNWAKILADDYCDPAHHISFLRAVGRRLRRNYMWILVIQAVSYFGKLMIHPTPLGSLEQLYARAAIGPIPGELIMLSGVLFNAGWIAVAAVTYYFDHVRYRKDKTRIAMG